MNKFRKLGFVDYTASSALTFNRGLWSVILHDEHGGCKLPSPVRPARLRRYFGCAILNKRVFNNELTQLYGYITVTSRLGKRGAMLEQLIAAKKEPRRESEVFRFRKKGHPVDWEAILARIPGVRTVVECSAGHEIYSQGQTADSVFYLRRGKMKITVVSQRGKEAIVCTLASGDFFGEGCLVGQRLRIATASAITDCILDRLDKRFLALMLHEHHDVSEFFVRHLLERNVRYEQDLVHQLFNSSEKRLARALLMLAHFGKNSRSETIVPSINQNNLAKMVGTTRSRINFFMNKFKKLGFVDYEGETSLKVNSSLLGVLLSD